MDLSLMNIVHLLVFPGFLFCAAFGLILMGIDRKVVARMQRRVGPPIMQPTYDFFKLVGKNSIIPGRADRNTFIIAPIIGLLGIAIIPVFIPIFGFEFVNGSADLIVILYLMTAPAVALILGGAASSSPYAGVGVSREVVTMISYELPIILVFLAVASSVGSAIGATGGITFSLSEIARYQTENGSLLFNATMIPAAIAFLLCLPAELGSVPFDVAEAEPEICEGPLVEYSGGLLAIYKITGAIKTVVLGGLFATLFVGGIGTDMLVVDTILYMLIITIVTLIAISFVRAIMGRVKIEHTFKFFWTVPTALAMVSLVLTFVL